jgi:two-component system phosphate regulon sensor histidine kinase PhoR
VNHHKPYADRKNIVLEYYHLPDQFNISIDVNGFEKLVSNLVSNALRYTLSGGRVGVGTFLNDFTYGFIVKDTGIGIPQEDLEKIFEEFYRSKNARETEQIGTGLGLNLVKEIVEHYGGEITVKSELGKGSEFKVEFQIDEKQTYNSESEIQENSFSLQP